MAMSWCDYTAIPIGTSEKPLTFDNDSLLNDSVSSLIALNVKKLGVVSQVHGNEIIELSFDNLSEQMPEDITNFGKADGIIVSNIPPASKRNNFTAIGIRTADCLPVIIEAKDKVALIHAGWRGLAANIIENAFNKLAMDSDTEYQVWIGPAAKKCCYEVGPEVVAALNINKEARQQKIDLQEQAIDRVSALKKNVQILSDDRCTICSAALHSFRKNNTKFRNLSFVVF